MKRFAHKVAYIAGGIIIGIVFSTSAGAFADAVKSMVGKKVTGEYTIVVDGKKLLEKGAVIDSKANVPARALSEALGADVTVSGKTITITSSSEEITNTGSAEANINTPVQTKNKYIGQSKSSLEEQKRVLLDRILAPTKAGREDILKEIALLNEQKDRGVPVTNLESFEKQLANYDADITKYEADLKLIDEALLTAK